MSLHPWSIQLLAEIGVLRKLMFLAQSHTLTASMKSDSPASTVSKMPCPWYLMTRMHGPYVVNDVGPSQDCSTENFLSLP